MISSSGIVTPPALPILIIIKNMMYMVVLFLCSQVDLLGDEVDTLLSLLEKIYLALDHYSPVLQHYPGVSTKFIFIVIGFAYCYDIYKTWDMDPDLLSSTVRPLFEDPTSFSSIYKCYNPILRFCIQITDTLKLVKRELNGISTRSG